MTEEQEDFTRELESLLAYNPRDLVRTEELGKDLNFESALPLFEKIIGLFRQLHDCNLEYASDQVWDQLTSQIKDARNKLQQVRDFSLKDMQNPIANRDSIIQDIRSQYETYYRLLSPVIAFSSSHTNKLEISEKRAREIIEDLNAKKSEISQVATEASSALQQVRLAAAEAGISQHAIYFKEAVEEFDNSSKWWLGATILIGIATAGWGLFTLFFHQISQDATTPQVLQATASKLIVFSALYYALIWSAKNYSAHRHNCVVNKHRQNALSTFEAFVKAAGDDRDTKNAVLLQATQSIFSAQSSGYVVKDAEADAPSKVIEIMRSSSIKS